MLAFRDKANRFGNSGVLVTMGDDGVFERFVIEE
jgi:hypothetical protein